MVAAAGSVAVVVDLCCGDWLLGDGNRILHNSKHGGRQIFFTEQRDNYKILEWNCSDRSIWEADAAADTGSASCTNSQRIWQEAILCEYQGSAIQFPSAVGTNLDFKVHSLLASVQETVENMGWNQVQERWSTTGDAQFGLADPSTHPPSLPATAAGLEY